jgi:hypothetical protein
LPVLSKLGRGIRTSAASAAALRASSALAVPPTVRGGPPTLVGLGLGWGMGACRGTDEVPFWGGGAEERVRPGVEKWEGDEGLPQRLPIAGSKEEEEMWMEVLEVL